MILYDNPGVQDGFIGYIPTAKSGSLFFREMTHFTHPDDPQKKFNLGQNIDYWFGFKFCMYPEVQNDDLYVLFRIIAGDETAFDFSVKDDMFLVRGADSLYAHPGFQPDTWYDIKIYFRGTGGGKVYVNGAEIANYQTSQRNKQLIPEVGVDIINDIHGVVVEYDNLKIADGPDGYDELEADEDNQALMETVMASNKNEIEARLAEVLQELRDTQDAISDNRNELVKMKRVLAEMMKVLMKEFGA